MPESYSIYPTFINSVQELMDSYTKAISKLVEDEDSWLNWYLYDRPENSPRVEIRGKNYIVKTIKDLLKIIEKSKD